jgi:hypothetical protein
VTNCLSHGFQFLWSIPKSMYDTQVVSC